MEYGLNNRLGSPNMGRGSPKISPVRCLFKLQTDEFDCHPALLFCKQIKATPPFTVSIGKQSLSDSDSIVILTLLFLSFNSSKVAAAWSSEIVLVT